jgi:hypothetical protein
VLASIAEVHPTNVVVIVNAESLAVREHVEASRSPAAVKWIVESTPSSMHSFLRVLESLTDDGDAGPFLISTVDAVVPAGAFEMFAERSRQSQADVVLAVVPVAPDDKPLLARVAGDPVEPARVIALGENAKGSPFMTAGYYSVRGSVRAEADAARRAGLSSLRAFFGWLLERGYRLEAVLVPEGIDVDRPSDVRAAEALLREARA